MLRRLCAHELLQDLAFMTYGFTPIYNKQLDIYGWAKHIIPDKLSITVYENGFEKLIARFGMPLVFTGEVWYRLPNWDKGACFVMDLDMCTVAELYKLIKPLMDRVEKLYKEDPNRIYFAGISGTGTLFRDTPNVRPLF